MTLLEHLHFTRPHWLLFIPMLLALLLALQPRTQPSKLPKLISANLLPWLEQQHQGLPVNRLIGLLCAVLFILGLAGISFVSKDAPMYESTNKSVFLIDQSLSMYADDLQPNRLTRLTQTIRDLLDAQQDGEVALVAYAGDAFVISPFSQDKQTLVHLLLALDPTIMPVYGSRLDIALNTGLELLTNQPSSQAHLVLFTDDIKVSELASVRQLIQTSGFHLDIISFGTPEGSSVKLPNGEILRDYGREVKPAVPVDRFEELGQETNIDWFSYPLTQVELEHLATFNQSQGGNAKLSNTRSQIWQEEGHWFSLPFLLWLLWQFRRGGLFLVLIWLGVKQPAQASYLDWLYTPDQLGQQAVDEGDWQRAKELFRNPKWRAASEYALENYQDTIALLDGRAETARDYYNLGNAKALSGDIEGAIHAYEQALQQQQDFTEAQENLDYLLKQQQQQQQQQQENDSQNNDSSTANKDSQASQNDSENGDGTSENGASKQQPHTATQTPSANQAYAQAEEDNLAMEQWMRQIQDDPGTLLQRKLWYLHQERRNENRFRQENGEKPW